MRLILRVEPVRRVSPVRPPPGPGVHVVYATDSGEFFSLGGRTLTFFEQLFFPYRMRYDVDTTDHRIVVAADDDPLLPVEVGFRVHDPLAVVRNLVNDPEPVIRAFLTARAAGPGPRDEVRLPEGITVFSVGPRQQPGLTPDEEDLAPRWEELPGAQHGSVKAREREELWWPGTVHGGGVRSSPPPVDDLERFLTAELPTSVRVGQEFSLVVRISVDEPWAGLPAAPHASPRPPARRRCGSACARTRWACCGSTCRRGSAAPRWPS
ncbi:hypothetical protein COUCH_10105 [Couchioplanes caeruleus]|uniref:hypothetical protein n=1 Tax=Couchioplanes caeruleus TaxID=56438 RepID=UPI0020C1503F|nr:hypothetical protein [Couchioplanes caeruleus]UQU66585.1 hypothetical protein COUCH_10105 [Couchioplanes caeruleus]